MHRGMLRRKTIENENSRLEGKPGIRQHRCTVLFPVSRKVGKYKHTTRHHSDLSNLGLVSVGQGDAFAECRKERKARTEFIPTPNRLPLS